MRTRTHRPRTAVRLAVAVALIGSAMVLAAVPAFADHCSGEGDIRDRGGDVVAECHVVIPGQPGDRCRCPS